MVSVFAPQFFLLLGVDIFIGASILSVLLDKYFPASMSYVLDLASFVGFAELLIGPEFFSTMSSTMQFYVSFGYTLIAILTVIALNAYLYFIVQAKRVGAVFATAATVPSMLATLFFTSAFVNGIPVALPTLPAVSMQAVYTMFFGSVGLVGASIAVTTYVARPSASNPVIYDRELYTAAVVETLDRVFGEETTEAIVSSLERDLQVSREHFPDRMDDVERMLNSIFGSSAAAVIRQEALRRSKGTDWKDRAANGRAIELLKGLRLTSFVRQ